MATKNQPPPSPQPLFFVLVLRTNQKFEQGSEIRPKRTGRRYSCYALKGNGNFHNQRRQPLMLKVRSVVVFQVTQ